MMTVESSRMNRRVLLTSIPRSMAWMSPSMMAFSALHCVMRNTEHTVMRGIMNAISSQLALPRLPMVQKTMPSILSPAMNVRRDTTAERREETATPARIRDSVLTTPPTLAMLYTRSIVAKHMTNARNGVTMVPGMNGMANSRLAAAPTDAPEDRPRM